MLYQNDDYGKDYLKGLKDGLGAKAASMIVAEESYETTEADHRFGHRQAEGRAAPTCSSISRRRNSPPRRSRRSPRSNGSRCTSSTTSRVSIGASIKPAGFDTAQDIISSAYLKDPTDPQWKDDAGMKAFNAFLDKYYPEANRIDAFVV